MKMMTGSSILTVFMFLFVFEALAAPKQATTSPFLEAGRSNRYDASLMISPVTLMQKINQKQKLFMVDIRNSKKFNTFKIPGSINISLSFIKTKPFLKTKPVVIIHESIAYSEIEFQAGKLNRKGFDIKILQGGLAAWKHKGGTLAGDPFAPQELNRISAQTFFAEKDHEEWVILNACSKELKHHKVLFPKAIHTSKSSPKIQQMVQAIFSGDTALKKQKHIPENNPLTAIVIFNEAGQDYEAIENKINKKYGHKVFYLKGGISNFQNFINSQMLAHRPKAERTREIGHCELCKKKKDNNEDIHESRHAE